MQELIEAKAEIELLKKYADHKPNCNQKRVPPMGHENPEKWLKCTCGLEQEKTDGT
jgi:hypothetical protein